ncbi:hypothetical protein [Francisella sp. SYW-2]|uniref:hypothetical protein n=1 Tax=Francisella sp. SYW-2 TaxID=2610886 RepID=UPI00123DB027|nr:hypothetical protein [Francisella sp. SYW-2]
MSQEKNIQQEQANDAADNVAQKLEPIKNKSSFNILSKISMVVSLVALGLASYSVIDFERSDNKLGANDQALASLQNQLESLKSLQTEQKEAINDLGEQNDFLTQNIKATQSQVTTLGNQVAVPTKDLYLQMSIVNIQSAINYLVLAKDVAVFDGDAQKANELVDSAFDKIEASGVATVSVSERQKIKDTLGETLSKSDVIKHFISIQQQFSKLKYITPEDISADVNTSSQSNYMKFLHSVVEIQNIPENQTLVATNQAKQVVSSNLYNSLIQLQSAMYSNDQGSIDKAKDNLIAIINQYFVQDNNAKELKKDIKSINSQNLDNVDSSLDKVINQLSEQQNKLLIKESSLTKTNVSAQGSDK